MAVGGREIRGVGARDVASFSYHPGSTAVTCTVWAETLHVSVYLPVVGHIEYMQTVLATDHFNAFSSTNTRGYCLDN